MSDEMKKGKGVVNGLSGLTQILLTALYVSLLQHNYPTVRFWLMGAFLVSTLMYLGALLATRGEKK